MGELESKVLELLNREYAISYITRELNIKDEYLADIIISLEDKGLVTLKDKKWKISEKGKDIFEKRCQLLKKLKMEYLYGDIGNRDEYDRKRKELEDMSQIISSTDEMIEDEHEKDKHEKDKHEKDEHEKEDEIAKTEVVHPEITLSPEIQIVEQKSEDEHLNSDTTRYEPPKESPKEESIKKICPKCGIENKPESNYCRKCGTNLKD